MWNVPLKHQHCVTTQKTATWTMDLFSNCVSVEMLLPIKISMRRPAALRCNGMNSEKFCSRLSSWGTVRSGRAIVLTWTCSSASPAPSLFTRPESALIRLSCEWTVVWTKCKKCWPAWDYEHAVQINKTGMCIPLNLVCRIINSILWSL